MATEHAHHHHHHEPMVLDKVNKAFIISIILNSAFVVVEAVIGLVNNSLALLSDAGHNLGDVFSLLLALLAFKLAKFKPTAKYTYGYRKSTILVSLLNACILLMTVGIILVESIRKLAHPSPMDGDAIAVVAGVGVLINGFTAWLFFKDKNKDLNVKGAYLHLAADTLVSVGVVVSGIIISFTGWYIIDPLIGIAIAVVIFISTWELLSHSIRLSLDGVPPGMNVEEIKQEMVEELPFVEEVHHMHLWAISTTQVALTAHVVLDSLDQQSRKKREIKEMLRQHGVGHVTVEFESGQETCPDEDDKSFLTPE
ncbi:MAG: cation diffusion facilitator family transporter [Bacteroidales bacterium]